MRALLVRARISPRLAAALGLLAIVGLIIMACGGGANAGSTTTGGNGSSSSSAKHFKVGDQVKVGDTFVVTINSVKTSTGNNLDKPKSGNVYLLVDVTIKNVSDKEQNISSLLMCGLKDSTGQKYEETIISDATAPDGKVEAGDVLRGKIPYEVPKSQHNFTFSFEADAFSSGQTLWDLKI